MALHALILLSYAHREFYVDLISQPGVLSELSFMSLSTMSVASPLRMSDSIDSQNERSLCRSAGSSSSSSSAQGTEEGVCFTSAHGIKVLA